MFVVIISQMKKKVLFCLRFLVVLAIFALLIQYACALLKGGVRGSLGGDAVSYHAARRYDILGGERFGDRFLKFWRDYYYGRPGKKEDL